MAKKIVFAWGRFNPPTVGHKVVMDRVAKEAKSRGAEYAIFASKSTDPKKNPLTFKSKVKFLKQSFPEHSRNINSSPKLKTVIDVMKSLDKRYDEVSLVVGSDRAMEFNKLLAHYNGREYDFDDIEIISAGKRDPDAEGVAGMSASKMRKAAAEGDFNSFKKGSPLKNAKPLYDAIRRGMKINEEIYGLMESVHNNRSVRGGRFNQMLRFGLVPMKYLPITQRAFKDIDNAAPNPELRKHIFDVTDKVLEYIMADDLLYRRMLMLLHNDFLMKEDHRDALLMKAQKSNLQYTTLLEVFLRGLVASPIYGDKTAQQYAFDRVNSFVAGGYSKKKTDADIWESCQQTETPRRSKMKTLSESNPPRWGTKEMADRYSKVTPGQPDDTAELMVSPHEPMKETAPPGKDAEAFITTNKEKFKKRYGDDKWEQVLYATAWKVYGKKESVDEGGMGNVPQAKKARLAKIARAAAAREKDQAKNAKPAQRSSPMVIKYRKGNQKFSEENIDEAAVDKDLVREMLLYITNDSQIYRSRITPIIKNLSKKVGKGTYDGNLAIKAFGYAVVDGLKKYEKDHANPGWAKTVSKQTREAIAAELTEYYSEQIGEEVVQKHDGDQIDELISRGDNIISNYRENYKAAEGSVKKKNEGADDVDEAGTGNLGPRSASQRGSSSMRLDSPKKPVAGWIAIYQGKKLEIKKGEADSLYGAKQKAIKDLKVPKSKERLVAIKPAYEEVDPTVVDEARKKGKTISKKDWSKSDPSTKHKIKGKKYKMQLDPKTGATVLVPVNVKEASKMIKVKLNPKKKIGYTITSPGKAGKPGKVLKRKDVPGKKNVEGIEEEMARAKFKSSSEASYLSGKLRNHNIPNAVHKDGRIDVNITKYERTILGRRMSFEELVKKEGGKFIPRSEYIKDEVENIGEATNVNKQNVPVYAPIKGKKGHHEVIGHVRRSATSVGATKVGKKHGAKSAFQTMKLKSKEYPEGPGWVIKSHVGPGPLKEANKSRMTTPGKVIKVNSGSVKSVGKRTRGSSVEYYWTAKSGLKNVFTGKDAKQKMRYSLRNTGNFANAEKVVSQLEEGRPIRGIWAKKKVMSTVGPTRMEIQTFYDKQSGLSAQKRAATQKAFKLNKLSITNKGEVVNFSEEVDWEEAQYWDEETVADFLKRGGKITKLKSRAARGSSKGKMKLKGGGPTGKELGRKAEKKMQRKLSREEVEEIEEVGYPKQTKKGVIAKAARKGTPPFTVVVIDRFNKVVKQETAQMADAVPAFVHELQKRYPKGEYKISVEDKGGSRVYSEEYVEEAKLRMPKETETPGYTKARGSKSSYEKAKAFIASYQKDNKGKYPTQAQLDKAVKEYVEEVYSGSGKSMIGRTRSSQELNLQKQSQKWVGRDRSLKKEKKAAHKAERKKGKKTYREWAVDNL